MRRRPVRNDGMIAKAKTKTVSDLRDDPFNPRKITADSGSRLERSMRSFGDLSGIVLNVRNGQLVGGHQRKNNLPPDAPIRYTEKFDKPTQHGTVAIGFIQVDDEWWAYREVDWDEVTHRQANIAANNPNVQGEFEYTILADVMGELAGQGADTTLTGFDDGQTESILTWSGDGDKPPGFKEKGDDIDVDYECPKCGYEWSGKAA